MEDRYDVAILGGGLAGLCLGIQLKKARPETSVLVTVGRKGPAPEAAFKVGESTVEISAHYFAEVIGLKDHIDERQLPKFSLRYFFPANGNRDITKRFEFGTSRHPAVPSYQLDRGRYENELWQRNIDGGVELLDDCKVSDVQFGDELHTVEFTRGGEPMTAQARWVVDTTGRFALLRNKLGLGQGVEHNINASWFRLSGGLKLDDFSDDPDWHARIPDHDRERWLSTNHLLDEGYWVWLIPLASGPISIGIVADPRYHPYEEINTLEGAISWLERHEPQLHAAVVDRRDQIEDFLTLERFSFGSERVFSPERWALSGEAGLFIDPFYSPGSDFIAMANTFITDLVVRDAEGEDIGQRLEFFNGHLLQLFHAFMNLYNDQYAGFGNPITQPAKLLWDHTVYWLVSCPRFLNGRLADIDFNLKVGPKLLGAVMLTGRMQGLFRTWRELAPPEPRTGFFDMSKLPGVWQRWNALGTRVDDADELVAAVNDNVDYIEGVAVQIFCEAARSLPGDRLPADARINPYGIGLDPEKWEEDGLLNGEGLTLAEARERAPGVDQVWAREPARA
jgi:flavin-dependent dehydrogenase